MQHQLRVAPNIKKSLDESDHVVIKVDFAISVDQETNKGRSNLKKARYLEWNARISYKVLVARDQPH